MCIPQLLQRRRPAAALIVVTFAAVPRRPLAQRVQRNEHARGRKVRRRVPKVDRFDRVEFGNVTRERTQLQRRQKQLLLTLLCLHLGLRLALCTAAGVARRRT